jgi:hypothetical protein
VPHRVEAKIQQISDIIPQIHSSTTRASHKSNRPPPSSGHGRSKTVPQRLNKNSG